LQTGQEMFDWWMERTEKEDVEEAA
jgi:hypothetical protein